MFKKVTDDDFSSIKIKSSKNVEAPKLPLDVKDFMRINNLVSIVLILFKKLFLLTLNLV